MHRCSVASQFPFGIDTIYNTPSAAEKEGLGTRLARGSVPLSRPFGGFHVLIRIQEGVVYLVVVILSQ